MRKQDRHRLITRLLTEKYSKARRFCQLLTRKGRSCNTSNNFRDIKDMKLIKVPSAEGVIGIAFH